MLSLAYLPKISVIALSYHANEFVAAIARLAIDFTQILKPLVKGLRKWRARKRECCSLLQFVALLQHL
jgi:hypothetical protein